MASMQEYRDERLRKLEQLRFIGIDPYPAHSSRTHMVATVRESFDEMVGNTITVAGRLGDMRSFGKIAFFVLHDASGQLQLFLRSEALSQLDPSTGRLGFEQLALLDSGDFIEASGQVGRTKTGEISVMVESVRLLAKSLRPLPRKLTDKEERLRRRYLDLNVNPGIRERFLRRSRFWQATRGYLDNNGFREINVPVLEHTTGGADATPFVTHMDALNQDFYLRISHELPLKRLLGGGYEKVYDIGPRFRNENYSEEHLPEHVAMEWYWAYADWREGMKFMEDMYKTVLGETFGRQNFEVNGLSVDLDKSWETWDYADVIKDRYGIDVYTSDMDEIKRALTRYNLEVEKSDNRARSIDKLWKNFRRQVAGPVWLINTPKFISPLAKANPDQPVATQRFQAILGGSELGNGFSELNDPVDQLDRFLEQQKLREQGDAEAMMLDIDFIEMLEYGMPPACGWGYSERVFWLFEGVSAREGVPFPQLKREISSTTRSIYPDVKFE